MRRHEWRDRTEDGEVFIYRALNHAGSWRFQSKPKKGSEWTYYEVDDFPLEPLRTFRETLWNKHQRRRVHNEHIDQIDAVLERREKEAAIDEEE